MKCPCRFSRRHGGEHPAKPLFHVVLVHDDLRAAIRALRVLKRLVHDLAGHFAIRCSMWSFAVLDLPSARHMAIPASAAADLLIISARSDNDLPMSVQDWLARFPALKAPGSAALVCLLESCQTSPHYPIPCAAAPAKRGGSKPDGFRSARSRPARGFS